MQGINLLLLLSIMYVLAPLLFSQSISDCVRHYYLAKKSENFKQMMRAKKRRHTFGKPQVSCCHGSCGDHVHDLSSQDMSRLTSPLLLGHSKPINNDADGDHTAAAAAAAGYSPNKLLLGDGE